MPHNAYKRRGIAGIPGRDLNSVRGALDISGLYPVRMERGGTADTEAEAEAQLQKHVDFMKGTRPSITPTLEELQAAQGIYKTYLGDSGYEQEREIARNNARLQAGLALAQAGFGFMGAQPRRGESPMSVMGRALAAPLAERIGSIAGTFAERDAARRTAQRAEERQIKLQAFQDVTSRKQATAADYEEQRRSAWEDISSGTSFLENQQTKIGDVWKDVGQIRRVMTGPFKNIPKYYNATTGAEITTPIRDYMKPVKGYKDSVTKLGATERWIPAPTTEDSLAGNWVEVPTYARITFNNDGSVNTSSLHFYSDNTPARFEDQTERRPNNEIVTLKTNARFVGDAGEGTQLSDAGKAQQWIREDGELVLSPVIIDTKVKMIDGVLTQVRVDNDEAITVGDAEGNYKLYEEQVGPTEAVLKGNREYEGALSGLAAYVRQGIIQRPIEKALSYGREGFTYQGVTLNNAAQNKVREHFRNVYDNTIRTLKVGMGVQKVQDLTKKFAEKFFNTPVTDILTAEEIRGDEDAAITEVDPTKVPSVINPEYAYQPYTRNLPTVIKDYGNLRQDFESNAASPNPRPAWEVMGAGSSLVPLPFHAQTTSDAIGRLALMATYSPNIWSNPHTRSDATSWETNQAGRQAIQNRLVAEQVAADSGVVSKSDDLSQRDADLRTEVARRNEKLNTKINSKVSVQLRTDVPTTVAMLEITDQLESAILRINPSGFIKGTLGSWLTRMGFRDSPIDLTFEQLLTGEVEGLDTKEVRDLYYKFLSQANILNELGGRALLKASGDTRYSDKDMEGVKTVLVKLGQTGGMNLANLQELRGYLLNGLNTNLTGIGTIGLTDQTVIRALKVGGTLEGVRPSRDGVWSPFVREAYSVTRNRTPGYDRNAIEQWRTEAALAGALKNGMYELPKTKGSSPWKKGQMEPVSQKDLFNLDPKTGGYIHQKLIDNYIWWRRALKGTQFGVL